MTAGNVPQVESYCRLSLPMVAEGKESAISIPGTAGELRLRRADPLSVEVFEKA